MAELRGYVDEKGNKPFAKWFSELDNNGAARVTTALTRNGAGQSLERQRRGRRGL
jgi:arginine/ornithine N-succinyltransferase beta subunit